MIDRRGVGVRCVNVVQIYTTAGGHDVVALRGVNVDIRPGEEVAMLGPSGSGKSTLLNLFGGVLRPSAGKVLVDGQDISRISERDLAHLRSGKVATLLQGANRNLLSYAKAVDNVAFARKATTVSQRQRLPEPAELLDRLGMGELSDRSIAQMSGGERQRVAFACAISSGAGLLLADEPTSQLSHDDRDAMIQLMHQVNQEFGTTVVMVTHDAEIAQQMPRSITIRSGRIGAEGRHGFDFGVIDEDMAVHIPEEVAARFPAGTLVQFEETADGLVLRPVDSAMRPES
jgi:putative ABC transport system ATP-binding protein